MATSTVASHRVVAEIPLPSQFRFHVSYQEPSLVASVDAPGLGFLGSLMVGHKLSTVIKAAEQLGYEVENIAPATWSCQFKQK